MELYTFSPESASLNKRSELNTTFPWCRKSELLANEKINWQKLSFPFRHYIHRIVLTSVAALKKLIRTCICTIYVHFVFILLLAKWTTMNYLLLIPLLWKKWKSLIMRDQNKGPRISRGVGLEFYGNKSFYI